jgi:hypothetical protein
MHHVQENHSDQSPALQTVHAALLDVRSKVVGLVRAWSQPKERYADLRSRARTPEAHHLIARIREAIEDLEQKGGMVDAQRKREIAQLGQRCCSNHSFSCSFSCPL